MENVYGVNRVWHEGFKRWYYTDDGGLSWYPEEGAAFNDYVNERINMVDTMIADKRNYHAR